MSAQAVAYRGPHSLNLASLGQANVDSIHIQPGDTLRVAVATGLEAEKPQEWLVRVDDRGTAGIPLTGEVRLAGLAFDEAESVVRTQSVERGIYRAPQVAVTLEARRTNRVTVAGAVEDPGIKELPSGGSDLVSALTEAGGFSDDASAMVEIRLPASEETGGFPAVRELDLHRIAGNPGSVDLRLPDGALVTVRRRPPRTVSVIGLVKDPSEVEMPEDRDFRLLDAIAKAGGRTLQLANKVQVTRQVPGRVDPLVIQTTVAAAKRNAESNLTLAPGDVISVEETPLTFTVDTLRSFIRLGFTGGIPGL